MAYERYFDSNRAGWDERVGIHLRDTSGIYPLDQFRAGVDLLGPIEAAEIGDVRGKKLLHLQCHFGIDTISLARRGADVTGLDFSPRGIETARAFAAELGVPARFVVGNVYDAPRVAGTGYDMVFTTWGTTVWLPDIFGWAQAVAGCLRPGGTFYYADGHPFMLQLEERNGVLEVQYGHRTPPDDPIVETGNISYAGDGTAMVNEPGYGWNHPLGDLFAALDRAGLDLAFFHEHEEIPWRAFPSMVPKGRMFVLPEGRHRIPLAMSLKAVKRGG